MEGSGTWKAGAGMWDAAWWGPLGGQDRQGTRERGRPGKRDFIIAHILFPRCTSSFCSLDDWGTRLANMVKIMSPVKVNYILAGVTIDKSFQWLSILIEYQSQFCSIF